MKIGILIIALALFFTKTVTSQKKDFRLIIAGGYSTHGTGDLPGYSFLNQVDIELTKRFFISPGIQFTNHANTYPLTGYILNYVTAGINVFTNINYLLLNKVHHRISIGGGPIVRFENSSVPDETGTRLDENGNQILILKNDKLRSTSLGYNITPAYYYQCNSKMFFGARFILQNDTKGDMITSELFFIGVKLK